MLHLEVIIRLTHLMFIKPLLLITALLSALILGSCSSSSTETSSKHVSFVSAGPWVKKGESVRFVCGVRFHDLEPGEYVVKAVFTSAQGEYAPKTVSEKFEAPLSTMSLSVSGFKQLRVGERHNVQVSLARAKKPNRVISSFGQDFVASHITPSMTREFKLTTQIIGNEPVVEGEQETSAPVDTNRAIRVKE